MCAYNNTQLLRLALAMLCLSCVCYPSGTSMSASTINSPRQKHTIKKFGSLHVFLRSYPNRFFIDPYLLLPLPQALLYSLVLAISICVQPHWNGHMDALSADAEL